MAASTPAGSGSRATVTGAQRCLLLDTGTWTASWRRVEYDIDEAADAIRAAGLPPILAERLYTGQ